MRKNIVLILMIILHFGCETTNNEQFKLTKSGMEYKIIFKAESDEKASVGDVWVLNIKCYTKSDSLIFNSEDIDQYFKMKYEANVAQGSIEEGLATMNIGDSTIFKVNAQIFYKYSKKAELPKNISPDEKLTFCVKLINIIKKAEIEKELAQIKEQQSKQEKILLKDYLDHEQIVEKPTQSGLYLIKIKTNKKGKNASNCSVTLNYTGYFIDGRIFDSSNNKKRPITIKLGENNVIPGWEEGLALMNQGEIARLIIPSNLAYADTGLKNLIPPYSTLVFDIELISINK